MRKFRELRLPAADEAPPCYIILRISLISSAEISASGTRLPSLVLGKFRSSTCRKITKALKILALNQYFFLAKFFLL